jgi:hypothetical protein
MSKAAARWRQRRRAAARRAVHGERGHVKSFRPLRHPESCWRAGAIATPPTITIPATSGICVATMNASLDSSQMAIARRLISRRRPSGRTPAPASAARSSYRYPSPPSRACRRSAPPRRPPRNRAWPSRLADPEPCSMTTVGWGPGRRAAGARRPIGHLRCPGEADAADRRGGPVRTPSVPASAASSPPRGANATPATPRRPSLEWRGRSGRPPPSGTPNLRYANSTLVFRHLAAGSSLPRSGRPSSSGLGGSYTRGSARRAARLNEEPGQRGAGGVPRLSGSVGLGLIELPPAPTSRPHGARRG